MDYYVWVLRGADRVLLVDSGFTAEVARVRGRDLLIDVLDGLRELGIEPTDAREVIVTHLHYDHAGRLVDLPRARLWLQGRELAFWTGRHAARPAFRATIEADDVVGVVRANLDGRVRFVHGSAKVMPGVRVHRVGGHTEGLQVVEVQTADGTVVLASDAAHFYETLESERPYSLLTSLPECYDAFGYVRELAGDAGTWVPGHDPAVMQRYPIAGTGLEGIAARIA